MGLDIHFILEVQLGWKYLFGANKSASEDQNETRMRMGNVQTYSEGTLENKTYFLYGLMLNEYRTHLPLQKLNQRFILIYAFKSSFKLL